MDKIKVQYEGPGSEDDPRTLTVTEAEADRLTKRGYVRVTKSKTTALTTAGKPTKKKEASNG
jgi:hypothetical protein